MSTVDELTEHVESIHNTVHVDEIYAGIKEKFIRFAETGDYKNILRVYNQKGMLPQSQLCKYCGISNKESYLNLVLSILKENKEDAIVIRLPSKNVYGHKKVSRNDKKSVKSRSFGNLEKYMQRGGSSLPI